MIPSDKIIEVGKLALLFSRVNRATLHEDGITPESDTDHTVMLGLCACAIASSYAPHLDLGKIAQFAFVHDLVEAYAGDTPTPGISIDAKKRKDEIEHESFLKIESQFKDSLPWIPNTIHEYESLVTEEARFIKTLDKAMPKITQSFNHGAQFKDTGMTREKITSIYSTQLVELQNSYGQNHPALLQLLEDLMRRAEASIEN